VTWWLVTFARDGGARYLSHLDTARAWQRTFARAGIILALSEGMRPKPRLSLGLPLPVGAAATGELLWAAVTDGDTLDPAAAMAALAAAAPEGIHPLSVRVIDGRPHPVAVLASYECDLTVTSQSLQTALDWFASLAEAPYERVSPKGRKQLDLRAFIGDLWQAPAQAGSRLGFSVRHRRDGAARPQEFVDLLATRLGVEPVMRALVRTRVAYEDLPDGEASGTTIGES
jgi:radical SAM-linked protein